MEALELRIYFNRVEGLGQLDWVSLASVLSRDRFAHLRLFKVILQDSEHGKVAAEFIREKLSTCAAVRDVLVFGYKYFYG